MNLERKSSRASRLFIALVALVVSGLALSQVGTTTQELLTAASTTSTAGINVPAGTAPTSPVNGDVWTTTAGMFVRINGATVGPLGAAGTTVTTGSFTASMTDACTTTPTLDVQYFIIGNMVTMLIPAQAANCTSDSTGFAATGTPVPANARPATAQIVGGIIPALDNSGNANACLLLGTTGTFAFGTLTTSDCTNSWVASMSKRAPRLAMSVTYQIN